MLKLYGIKNCDSVKKAKLWLEANHLPYVFHDFKTDGLAPELLQHFIAQSHWETLLNRRSTSWKQLSDSQRHQLSDATAADLMLAVPTLIKRPVLDNGTRILIGFDAEQYLSLISQES